MKAITRILHKITRWFEVTFFIFFIKKRILIISVRINGIIKILRKNEIIVFEREFQLQLYIDLYIVLINNQGF